MATGGHYPAKKFLEVWDKLLDQYHESDRGLAKKAGLSSSTVPGWKTGRTTLVRPTILRKIESRLGVKIDTKTEPWVIDFKKQNTQDVTTPLEGRITTIRDKITSRMLLVNDEEVLNIIYDLLKSYIRRHSDEIQKGLNE